MGPTVIVPDPRQDVSVKNSVRCNCLMWESLPKAKVAEWQTRWTQNPVSLTDVWVRLPPLVL